MLTLQGAIEKSHEWLDGNIILMLAIIFSPTVNRIKIFVKNVNSSSSHKKTQYFQNDQTERHAFESQLLR